LFVNTPAFILGVVKHLKKMRNLFKILFFLFLLSSCQNEPKEIEQKESEQKEPERKVFYFPNQSEFSKSDYQYIDLESFSSFDKLVDSIENLKYHTKYAALKIETDKVDYHVLVSTIFGQDHPPIIKLKNILLVSNDSVKKNKAYPIKDLKEVLKKDIQNNGKDDKFSESPEKLIVSVTSNIDELENLLIKILKTFEEIQNESSDPLPIKIQLNGRKGIFLPPPSLEE